jgi:hypothetical protein
MRRHPSISQNRTPPQPLQPSQPHQTTRIHTTCHQPSTNHSLKPQSQSRPSAASQPQAAKPSRSTTALTRLLHRLPRPERPATPNTTNGLLQLPCELEQYLSCSNKHETPPFHEPKPHTAAAPATITTTSNNPHPHHLPSTLNQPQLATAISIEAISSIATTSGKAIALKNSSHLVFAWTSAP